MKISISLVFCFMIAFSCNQTNKQTSSPLKKSADLKEKAKNISCKTAEKEIFSEFIKELEFLGYIPQKLKYWGAEYKNHINPSLYEKEQQFIILPKDQVWYGIRNRSGRHNRERSEIRFDNAIITEIVVRKTPEGYFGRDVKIVQFLFNSDEEAKKAEENMKLISYYTINTDGLKNPNYWWFHNCAIYFCRARSAATPLKPICDAFEKKNGKIQLMRW